MPDTDEPQSENRRPAKLQQIVKADLGGVSQTWDINGLDCADELRDAIEAVCDDHDHVATVGEMPIWQLRVEYDEDQHRPVVAAYGFKAEYSVGYGEGDG